MDKEECIRRRQALAGSFEGLRGVFSALGDPNRQLIVAALPSSGISGSQCFYNCRNLVGGNGTAWSSSNVGCTYFRIDAAGTPGYLTVA